MPSDLKMFCNIIVIELKFNCLIHENNDFSCELCGELIIILYNIWTNEWTKDEIPAANLFNKIWKLKAMFIKEKEILY